MKEHNKFLPKLNECKEFTLFLDRDGVINKPIVDDYAKTPNDFVFCEGAVDAISDLQKLFNRVIIVTNQQGVHREVMSEKDLENVHLKLYNGLKEESGRTFDLTLGLLKVRITNPQFSFENQDFQFTSLKEFVAFVSN